MKDVSFPRLTAFCGWLTRLYPERFRRRFARDLNTLFLTECERSYRAEGAFGVSKLTLMTFAGMILAAGAERLKGASARRSVRNQHQKHRSRATGGNIMTALFQDVRYGLRNFLKTPGFALLAVLTLGLGIAVNTTIFSLINTVLFSELPVKDPDRFVFLWATNERAGENRSMLAISDVADVRAQMESFENVSFALEESFILTGEGEPRRLASFRVTDNFFDTWGIGTVLGRGFVPGEARPGAAPVVVLSHGFWERFFGSDPSVVGRTLRLDGESYTIVGVLSPKMEYGDISSVDIWVPHDRDIGTAPRDERIAFVQALLRKDVSVASAQREAAALATRLGQDFPASHSGWSFRVSPVSEELLDDEDGALVWMLVICVAFVLLIACANVANMVMARSTSRSKEVAVRLALGASRLRLLRQFITEGFLLSITAGALGLLLARGLLDLLVLITLEQQWIYRSAALDERVLLFTLGISLLTPFLFSLFPSLRASRPDLTLTLKEGGRSGSGRSGMRSRRFLVGAQVSMALMLMVVTGLLVRSVIEVRRTELGFETKGILSVMLDLPEAEYPSDEGIRQFSEELLGRASETRGVTAAAIMSPRPFGTLASRRNFRIEGAAPLEPDRESPSAYLYQASPDFLSVMRMRLLSGRTLEGGDNELSFPVALVNETAAKRYWPDEGPLGGRFQFSETSDDARWVEIVGVVGDIIQLGRQGNTDPVPQIFFPFAQRPSSRMALLVRTEGEPTGLTDVMREHVLALGQPVDEMRTMSEIHQQLFASSNAVIALFVIFATFALLMASMGIYGVMSYAVSQQEREIGIRMALGASGGDVLRIVVGQGAKLVLIGAGVGMVGAVFLGRMLSSVGFGVTSLDPLTFVSVPILLTLVAILANYIPARRATRIAPIETLRTE